MIQQRALAWERLVDCEDVVLPATQEIGSTVRNSPDSFRFCVLSDSVTPWLDEKLISSIDALLVSLNFSRRALVADAVKNTPESDAQVDREEAR